MESSESVNVYHVPDYDGFVITFNVNNIPCQVRFDQIMMVNLPITEQIKIIVENVLKCYEGVTVS